MAEAKSVSEITFYIKRLFKNDDNLTSVLIKGEVSNCKYHSSGHIYFTLKDEVSSILSVMFRGSRDLGLNFKLEDGQKVIIAGEVSVYERDGRYQLYCRKIILDGVGRLYEELEKLKKKFEAEGLFDPKYKKKIPLFPSKIGIVTAKTGAAIQDIYTTAKRRNPFVELILFPAKVQGEGAAETIVKGIHRLEQENVDVIIIGRGGGSIEDLWCFNEEIVARAVFASETPIISAVGHEVDYTISDFVADLRAATPTAAAELAVPDVRAILSEVLGMKKGLEYKIKEKIKHLEAGLERLELRLIKESPGTKLRVFSQRVDEVEDFLKQKMERKLMLYQNALSSYKMSLSHKAKMKYEKTNRTFLVLVTKIEGLSPLARLKGGYSYVENQKGKNINSISKLKVDEKIKIIFSDGSVRAKVEEICNG